MRLGARLLTGILVGAAAFVASSCSWPINVHLYNNAPAPASVAYQDIVVDLAPSQFIEFKAHVPVPVSITYDGRQNTYLVVPAELDTDYVDFGLVNTVKAQIEGDGTLTVAEAGASLPVARGYTIHPQ